MTRNKLHKINDRVVFFQKLDGIYSYLRTDCSYSFSALDTIFKSIVPNLFPGDRFSNCYYEGRSLTDDTLPMITVIKSGL